MIKLALVNLLIHDLDKSQLWVDGVPVPLYKKLNPGNLILQALENGVYVVGSCGFDSIPSDLGQAGFGNVQISLNNIFVYQIFKRAI